MKKTDGSIFLFLAALVWGLSFVAQSSAMDSIGPYFYNLARSILALITLSPLLIKSLKKTKKVVIIKSFKSGLICGIPMALGATFQQLGLVETSAGKAGFITALYIVIVPLFGLFTGRKISKKVTLSLVLAVIGFYFLCISDDFSLNKYDLYVAICSLCYALQIVFVDKWGNSADSIILSCSQFVTMIVISSILAIVNKETMSLKLVKDCFVPIFYSGVFSNGLGYTFQIIGQKTTDPAISGLLMSLESVFSAIFGFIILHNSFSLKEMLGCTLIFTAVILSELPEKKRNNNEKRI